MSVLKSFITISTALFHISSPKKQNGSNGSTAVTKSIHGQRRSCGIWPFLFTIAVNTTVQLKLYWYKVPDSQMWGIWSSLLFFCHILPFNDAFLWRNKKIKEEICTSTSRLAVLTWFHGLGLRSSYGQWWRKISRTLYFSESRGCRPLNLWGSCLAKQSKGKVTMLHKRA